MEEIKVPDDAKVLKEVRSWDDVKVLKEVKVLE